MRRRSSAGSRWRRTRRRCRSWMPYVDWQQMQDASAPAGRFYYWKTANYSALSEHTLEQFAAAAHDLPTPRSEIHLQHMGGAVGRVPADERAFARRAPQLF